MSARAAQGPLRILVGICGGIAAYKVPDLIRRLRREGADVKVILTRAAKSLVGSEALRTVSQNPVHSDDDPPAYDMDHIRLSQWADLFLVCPATANTIAKLASGIADNLLTSTALSFRGTIMIAPAMNSAMWDHPATKRNVEILTAHGVRVLPVDEGELACGDRGAGRMLEPQTIVNYALCAGMPAALAGKKVLIASGPTAEPIDAVRVITNRSSGKMGAALAQAAQALGAEVTVVSGPAPVSPPPGVKHVPVMTASEMAGELANRFEKVDICIMAAAVADFRPAEPVKRKLHRGDGPRTITLVPNPDISAQLGKRKRGQFLICFSLEEKDNVSRAREKMLAKNCDMMVLNTVEASLGTDTSRVTLLFPKGKAERLGPAAKRELALEILLRVSRKVGGGRG